MRSVLLAGMVDWCVAHPNPRTARRLAMSEPKDLLLIIEQLRRSNRRWKTLALAACSALILVGLVGFIAASTQRMRAVAELRAANAALVRAQMAANPGQPR